MNYQLKPHTFFLEQMEGLYPDTLRQLQKKIEFLKSHPFRNAALKGYGSHLYRIKFKDNNKEKRLVYRIDGYNVHLLFILDRDKEYKDLKEFLKRVS